MNSSPPEQPDLTRPGRKWVWVGLLLIVAGSLAIYFRLPAKGQHFLQYILDQIKPLGFWAPILYILLYIVACVALIPGAVLTLGGGALFGLVEGFIYVSIGATLGATAAFLCGRHFARGWIAARMGRHPTFVAIDKAVGDEGWKIVLLTRVCPIFPFFLMNYAYGLTRVSLRHYVVATWIGIIPGSALLVYLGSLAQSSTETRPGGWAWKAFALITAVVTTLYLTRVARRALRQKLEASTATQTPAKGEPV